MKLKRIVALMLILCMVFSVFGVCLASTGDTQPSDGDGSNEDTTNGSGISYENYKMKYYKGEVIGVSTITHDDDPELAETTYKQVSLVKIISGKFADRVYELETTYSYTDTKQIYLEIGTIVMLSATLDEEETDIVNISISDYYRTTQVWVWIIIAFAIILIICRFKGIKTLVGILMMVLGLYFIFIPLVLKGANPLLVMLPLCVIVGCVTIFLDLGFNYRGVCAAVGMAIGLAISCVAGIFVENAAQLVGLGETELELLYFATSIKMPISFATMSSAIAMLIALGGIIDTCVAVTEEMMIIKVKNPYITKKSLIEYGLERGRYNMSRNVSTVVYTILAAIVPTLIIYQAFETPFMELMNMDFIASLLLRAVAAVIGIVVSMPATGFIYAFEEKKDSLYS